MSTTTINDDHPNDQSKNQTIIKLNHGQLLDQSNSIQILLMRPSTMESITHPIINNKNNGNDNNQIGNENQTDQIIQIHSQLTKVHHLKSHISQRWQGKPKLAGIRLIAHGRILNDSETVSEAISKSPGDLTAHPIHVVIRPNAWTEKLASEAPTRSASAPPLPTLGDQSANPSVSSAIRSYTQSVSTQPQQQQQTNLQNTPLQHLSTDHSTNETQSAHSTLSSQNSSSAELLITYFASLTSSQRTTFIQNLLQAQFKIVLRLDFLRCQLRENHLRALGLLNQKPQLRNINLDQAQKEETDWKAVDAKLTKLLIDLNFWNHYSDPNESSGIDESIMGFDTFSPDECSEFKRVEIAGSPYLLYIPENLRQRDPTRLAQASQIQTYKALQRELNRTLYMEAQVHLLIAQCEKLASHRRPIDDPLSPEYLYNLLQPNHPLPPYNNPPRAPNMFGALGLPLPPNPLGANPPLAPAHAHGPAGGLGFGLGLGADLPLQPNNLFFAPNAPLWQHPMARVRRYEFTINLDSLRRYIAPLLWLSVKLSVLLYIFGRHASVSKLIILAVIALGWVLWEAFSISQRHEAQARRRDRLQRGQPVPGAPGGGAGAQAVDPIQAVLDRGRRRAERDRLQQMIREQRHRADGLLGTENQAAAAPPANEPQPPGPAPAQPVEAPVAPPVPPANIPARRNPVRGLRAAAADIRARGGAFPPGTEVRPFRATSMFSPKYWFNSVAVVGLASEYRELGLHSIGERSMGTSNREYPRWYRYLRNTRTCVVLFFGTLLPEIEKKRKKALEKRARILNLVIADAARDANNANANANPNQNQNQNQEGRAVAQTGGTPNGEPVQPAGGRLESIPAAPASSSTSANETSRSLEDNEKTPRAVTATALEKITAENSENGLTLRKPRQVGAESEEVIKESDSNGGLGANQTEVKQAGNYLKIRTGEDKMAGPQGGALGENEIGREFTADQLGEAAPIAGSSSAPHELPQEAVVRNNDNLTLQSPLTPLDTPQVVGGLDDTDEEELIGADNDEAGMLLF